MSCPDPEHLAQYADGRLAPEASEVLRAHVDDCTACREVLIALARSSQASPGSEADVPWDVPLPGARLGRYRVTGTRGAGGMGVVVAAYDPQLDREVALKLLRPDANADAEAARLRLVREAQLMARVRHPNVVTVHDVVVEGDQVFIAMALVDGLTVGDWLERAPRSHADIVRVFLEAGRGLAAAHRAGVVHRDFKPDNVLVDAAGHALVSDFGLAWSRAVPTPAAEDSASGPIGTPAYMAPEQLVGGTVDARADQFSYCVALFEALQGRRPFEATTRAALLEAITQGPPSAERALSKRLRQALVRGLAADPAQRFPSMEALLEALTPRQVSGRRWRWLAGLSASALGVAGGLWLRSMRADCSDFAPRLERALPAERRAALEARLTPERAAPLLARLDVLVQGLSSAWASSCASRDERDRVVRTCLTQRAEQLELTAAVLALPTIEARAALMLVSRLDDERACLDGELLTLVPMPDAPAAAEQVRAARREALTADALRLSGALDDARAMAEQAVTTAQQSSWRPVEAEARLAHAQALRARGAFDAAEAALGEALLAAEAGRHFEAIARIAVQHILVVGTQTMRPADAEPWVRRAEAALEQLPRPRLRVEVDVATTMLRVAQGDLSAALMVSERALRWARDHDASATADLRHLRAQALLQQGRHGEALAEARDAAATRVRLLGPTHPLALHARVTLGDALARAGLALAAKVELGDALDAVRQRRDVGPLLAATGLVALGLALEQRGELAEALASTRRAQEVVEATFGPTHRYTALAHRAVGERLRAMGRTDEGLAALRMAVQVGEGSVGLAHRETLESQASLALALALLARDEAEPLATAVLDATARDAQLGEGPAVVAGLALAALPRASTAVRAEAVARARRVRGDVHPDVVRALLLQGRAGADDPAREAAVLEARLQVVDDAFAPFRGPSRP
jgi:tetratricopeptide (TPR) repeat protein